MIVIGPGIANVDFSVRKVFQLTERQLLEFRTEFFNLFNRANFFQPGDRIGSGNFGAIGAAFDGRDIQFGLRYRF